MSGGSFGPNVKKLTSWAKRGVRVGPDPRTPGLILTDCYFKDRLISYLEPRMVVYPRQTLAVRVVYLLSPFQLSSTRYLILDTNRGNK